MTTLSPAAQNDGRILPSEASSTGATVFVVSGIGFDFGTPEIRDAFTSANNGKPILTNADMEQYLSSTIAMPAEFGHILWTLVVDGEPAYVLDTLGDDLFNTAVWADTLLKAIGAHVDRAAFGGVIVGAKALLDGRTLPLLRADMRTYVAWNTADVAGLVRLHGSFRRAPITVDMDAEGSLDWSTWSGSSPRVRRNLPVPLISDLAVVSGGDTLLSPYAGSITFASWVGGTPVASGVTAFGAALPPSGQGASVTVALSGDNVHVLRIYGRSHAARTRFSASLSDASAPDLEDLSWDGLLPVAGMPGVVDGALEIRFRPASSLATLKVAWTLVPEPNVAPHPHEVAVFQNPAGGGATQKFGVGVHSPSSLTLPSVGSALVPAGLRLTLFTSATAAHSVEATAPGASATDVPAGFNNPTYLIVVEPDSSVGILSMTLGEGAEVLSLETAQTFLDNMYSQLPRRGTTPEERAVGFATAELFRRKALREPLSLGLTLESIEVRPLSSVKPGARCFDVRFRFFPVERARSAPRTVLAITVDTSASKPEALGAHRRWTEVAA